MKRFIICIIVNIIILLLLSYFYRPINTIDMMIGVILAGINVSIFKFNNEEFKE